MSVNINKTEGGYKRANPLADPHSSVKLKACLECSGDICQDYLSKDLGGKKIKGFNYSEIDGPVLFPTPIDPVEFEMAFCEAVQDVPTISGLNATYETKIIAGASVEGQVVTLYHVGQTVVESLILDDDTVEPLTRKCYTAKVCDFEQFAVGTDPVLTTQDGSGTVTGQFPYDAATPAVNETTANAFKAAIVAALATIGTTVEGVSVEVDDINGGYTVTITSQGGFEGTIGGKDLENCGCYKAFVDDPA